MVSRSERLWNCAARVILALVFAGGFAGGVRAADVTVDIDAAQVHQTWYGFGCTHNSGIFGSVDTMTASQRAQYVDLLFNQVRIRTGQIPSAFEAPSNSGINFFVNQANDDANPANINWNGFCTFYSDQFKANVVDLAGSGETGDLYPDVHINTRWASKWLEPIRTSNYSAFLDECAEQVLAQIIVFKNTYGREPLYAHLYNEPTSGNGELLNGTDTMIADIVARCGDRLRANGFSLVKFVVASQETEEVSLTTAVAVMSNPNAAKYVGAIAYHTYPYGSMYSYIPNILNTSGRGQPNASRIAVRQQLRDLGKQYGVPVWMTEVSNGFYGDNTPANLDSFTGAIGRAIHIHDEMLYAEASSYFGMNGNWSIAANQMHFGNTGVGANPDDVIFIDQPNNRVFITGIGRAIGHYARFINKGAQILTSSSSNPLVQVTSARDSVTGALSVVVINNDSIAHSLAVNVAGLALGGNVSGEQSTADVYWNALTPFPVTGSGGYTVTVPAQSITSLSAGPGAGNRPPVVTSGPSALPASVAVGEVVNFVADATDPDGDTLSYAWDFGDGSTGAGAAAAHAFGAAGNYVATISVADGRGGFVSASVTISVSAVPPVTYALTVSNGSGSGQYTAGTVVAISANAAPTGQVFDAWTGAAVADASASTTTLIMPAAATTVAANYKTSTVTPGTLTITRLSGSVYFNAAGKDACAITGSIPDSGNSVLNGTAVTLDIGGAVVAFTLNARGSGNSSNGTIKFTRSGTTLKFTAALSGGSWSESWANAGLTGTTVSHATLSMPVQLTLGTAVFAGSRNINYSAAKGRGRFK